MTWYYVSRIVLAVALPALAFLFIRLGGYELSNTRFLGALAGAGIAGLMAPSFYISPRRGKKMKLQCREGFPDFMDLMVVVRGGGHRRGGRDRTGQPRAGAELSLSRVSLHMASLELRAGKPLIEAFKNLADRLGIEEAHNLGSLLQQSEELGTSLSDALRVYSDEMRDKRMSRAEEKAHALPAKMAVPLTMFVFPDDPDRDPAPGFRADQLDLTRNDNGLALTPCLALLPRNLCPRAPLAVKIGRSRGTPLCGNTCFRLSRLR